MSEIIPNHIEVAIRYYNDAIIACLDTESDARKQGNEAMRSVASLRRKVYQEYRKAVKYMQTSGCNKKTAWSLFHIAMFEEQLRDIDRTTPFPPLRGKNGSLFDIVA